MNEEVKNYIKYLEKQVGYTEMNYAAIVKGKITKEEKNKLALSEGLIEKIFSPLNEKSNEYPEIIYNQETKDVLYYKKQPLEISDDEYIRIIELKEIIKIRDKSKNLVSLLNFFLTMVIVCGVIFAIIFNSMGNSVAMIITLLITLVDAIILYAIRVAVKTSFECKARLDSIESKR